MPGDLIEDFINRYRKEYDFYDQAARLVQQSLDSALHSAGIRSIVTSRAKGLQQLEVKVRQRAEVKDYKTIESIFEDIVDLAGVRVALYFPGEIDQVDKLINQLFVVIGFPKQFPDSSPPKYDKRFTGYRARHYIVRLKETTLSEAQKRYAEARVEAQVASVLMHAWAEVEHDLVYKPLAGYLSHEEYAILDELNGLVLTGEIALEQLQKAGETRVAQKERRFSNHYDLAAYLIDQAATYVGSPLADSELGRIDLLFEFLEALDIATPERLERYVAFLDADLERRPVAEQIVDRLLAEGDERYRIYQDVRARQQRVMGTIDVKEREPGLHQAVGAFLSQWNELERKLKRIAAENPNLQRALIPSRRVFDELELLDTVERADLDQIRRLRNSLVHGLEIPHTAEIQDATIRLQVILSQIP